MSTATRAPYNDRVTGPNGGLRRREPGPGKGPRNPCSSVEFFNLMAQTTMTSPGPGLPEYKVGGR